MIFQKTLEFHTPGRGTIDITDAVEDVVKRSDCEMGLCQVFIQHTSASLIICEHSDPEVRKDLERMMSHLIPDGSAIFHHVAEGPDDMPSHARTILTQTHLTIPIKGNGLALGTWQGIYLWEHRQSRHHRKIIVTIQG